MKSPIQIVMNKLLNFNLRLINLKNKRLKLFSSLMSLLQIFKDLVRILIRQFKHLKNYKSRLMS